MLIEIKGSVDPHIEHFEQERDFYAGAKETNIIKVRWPKLDNSFISLSFENIRGKVFGPVYSDSPTEEVYDNNHFLIYETSFCLSNDSILIPGDLQITVYLNITNAETSKVEKSYCLGRVVSHIKKSTYAGTNIMIVGGDPQEVITDFNAKMENLNILVNKLQLDKIEEEFSDIRGDLSILSDKTYNLETKVKNLKPIRTVESVPSDFKAGEYLFLEIN